MTVPALLPLLDDQSRTLSAASTPQPSTPLNYGQQFSLAMAPKAAEAAALVATVLSEGHDCRPGLGVCKPAGQRAPAAVGRPQRAGLNVEAFSRRRRHRSVRTTSAGWPQC